MTTNTKIEDSLIEKISNDDLKNSLFQIRKSAIAIWSSEAPRIIQGFTDHGFEHSLRLINYASKLLNTNKGNPLSDEEMYLLMAAIYLHDIGMQCDITKFPKIKEKAIIFGANFTIEFTSKNANQYSLAEQIEIRKNHHCLSSAWIDYSFHTEGTALDNCIKTIPFELLKDLIEICKYHSSLNIVNCPIKLEIKQGRKQLVAALLRFADELDIDKNRVSIETVNNFSMDSNNAFYWWLHHLTVLNIEDNSLKFIISLYPSDFKNFGLFIKETFIDKFRKKNDLIIDVLNTNSFNIFIDANSDVKINEYASKLPNEIVKVIQEMQNMIEISSNKNIVSEIKQITKIQLNNFPIPKPYFVGRATELLELKETFSKNPFIFIEGGGGIGKTQFVAKFIEGLEINNKIIWYECIPTSLPDDIIKGSGFEELLKGKEKAEFEKFSAFKDKIEENNFVVFLDNYQEVENIPAFKSFLGFINDYLSKGHLIVLCRDSIITPQLQPKRIALKGLGNDSISHARKLIEHSYPNLIKISKEELKSICDTFKGYPLAIDLAIYLLSLNVSVENIINVAVIESQSEGSEIEKISNRLLNEIFTRPDASNDEREFLKLLSIFRGKIFKNEALSVINQTLFENANRKLINRNLLEFNNDYLELHPLIREFCYNELKNKKEVHDKAAKYYINLRTNYWNPELEEKIFYHLTCAEQWKDISEIIIKLGREFILHGYLDRLQQMISTAKHQNIFEPIFDIFEGKISEIKANWDVAISFFENAIQSLDQEVKIEGMIKYGEILYKKGNVKEAQLIFDDIIKITQNSVYKKWYARALNDLGLVNKFFGNSNVAISFYNIALQIRQELGEEEDIASSLINIGSLKDDLGFKNEAIDLYEKSLKISQKLGNKSSIATSLNNIGAIKERTGSNKEALTLYEKSLHIYEEIGDKSGIALSLNNIGLAKNNLGFEKEALDMYEKSLKISEEIGDKSGVAHTLNNIGFIKSKAGFKKIAISFYEKSLKIQEEIGDKSSIASCFNNIGSIKSDIGLKKEALDYFERSLRIQEEIGNKSSIATCLNNIGSLKSSNGFSKETLALFERSLKINEEIGNIPGISTCLNNIGSYIYKNNLDFEKPCLYFLKSIALRKQIGLSISMETIGFLNNMRQEIGKIKFKELFHNVYPQLEEEFKALIIYEEIFSEPIKVEKILGRNEPCHCGSGKKYKHCHGKLF